MGNHDLDWGADTLRMRMAGADPRAELTAEDRLPGVSNYFVGDDPSRWLTDVPSYARVRREAVWPKGRSAGAFQVPALSCLRRSEDPERRTPGA